MKEDKQMEFLIKLTDKEVSMLETKTGIHISDGNDLKKTIEMMLGNTVNKNAKSMEILILVLKMHREMMTNPLKKLTLQKHINHLEHLIKANEIWDLEKFSTWVFRLQINRKIQCWEKAYLNALIGLIQLIP